jgi:hypothetical protein
MLFSLPDFQVKFIYFMNYALKWIEVNETNRNMQHSSETEMPCL